MLESLTIRQIALIDEVTIRFHRGMHVLTGETGAGKSIVVDSVNLILGGRADRDMIRTGFEKASVEAVFNIKHNSKARTFLDQEGIENDGQTMTVYREISLSGKNLCRICSTAVPLSLLKNLASVLLDLHGQSEHHFLTDPAKQLLFLDQTGDKTHAELLIRIKQDFDTFIANHRSYAKMVRQNENREARKKSLEKDLEELRKAHVEPGEADRLLVLRKQYADMEKKATVLHNLLNCLSGGENEASTLEKINDISSTMKTLAETDESFLNLSSRFESAYYELEEIAYQISLISERLDYDPGMLDKTEDRIDLIHRLERKHAADADELPSVLKSLEEEFLHMTDIEDSIAKMSEEHKLLLAAYRKTARKLTESRQKLASEFEQHMQKELNDLGMPETRFQVHFIPNEKGRPVMPTPQGDDRIEFLISPNPGEPLKPITKIASGGELSRLMLAVKTLESSHSGVPTMVFDEIDTGISGRTAQVVAEKMNTISREKQVICVTHLPQIASAADYHYLVSKSASYGRTKTEVTELNREGRTLEVGRMISGADGISKDSYSYAARLIEAAQSQKNKS